MAILLAARQDEHDAPASIELESDSDVPTMPPPALPNGPVVEVVMVNLRSDPRAE